MNDKTPALEVFGLCKTYPAFTLKEVSFAVPQGTVMGFIGRNGAGFLQFPNAAADLAYRKFVRCLDVGAQKHPAAEIHHLGEHGKEIGASSVRDEDADVGCDAGEAVLGQALCLHAFKISLAAR